MIQIVSDNLEVFDQLKPFLSLRDRRPDLKVYLHSSPHICKPDGKVMSDGDIKWVRSTKRDSNAVFYICKENSDEIISILEVNSNWSCASCTYLKNCLEGEYAIIGALGEILFFYGVLFHQGIVIHAAAIECEGKGIVFSAPSGTGKSTQANLWKVHKKAKILNGDRPVIRVPEERSYVYGTPWSG